MGKFCRNCGKPLQEGEICSCTQQKIENSGQKYEGFIMQKKKNKVPRLLVPIGQTVAGGILLLLGFITGTFDWSFMSYVAGAGFLLTGICGLIEAEK